MRNLGIPTVIDRIIQQAMVQVLSPIFEEQFKELTARGLNFVRYADDCIILVKSEKAANRVLKSITKFIEKKLGLKVNAEKSKVTRPTQTKYLCSRRLGKLL